MYSSSPLRHSSCNEKLSYKRGGLSWGRQFGSIVISEHLKLGLIRGVAFITFPWGRKGKTKQITSLSNPEIQKRTIAPRSIAPHPPIFFISFTTGHWFADDTFKTAPELFYQIYTMHALVYQTRQSKPTKSVKQHKATKIKLKKIGGGGAIVLLPKKTTHSTCKQVFSEETTHERQDHAHLFPVTNWSIRSPHNVIHTVIPTICSP